MKAEVQPSTLRGSTSVEGSKSIAQRAVACALMSNGTSIIRDFPQSDDCIAALNAARQLGAIVSSNGTEVSIKGGFPSNFQSGIRNAKSSISCAESGLSARMFACIVALSNEEITLNGTGSLLQRPFDELLVALPKLGVTIDSVGGRLPLNIKGPMKGGAVEINGGRSSQFVTGLLMALPKTGGASEIKVNGLASKPYIDMTLEMEAHFGVAISSKDYSTFTIASGQNFKAADVLVSGDWSGAAFVLVAAALCSEEGVTVENLDRAFTQADSQIVEILRLCDVHVSEGRRSITVKKSVIRAFDFDATHCPDLFPVLAVLASFADGACTIKGAKRLIHKESNRAKALQEEWAKANIRIVIRDDEMKIYPAHAGPAIINPRGDHRIAMAAAVMGMAGQKITIQSAECVNKSFPSFFDVMSSIGGRIALK